MYDCPRCNGVETLRYNLYYDVFACLACGVTFIEDAAPEPVVIDYIREGSQVIPVSEYLMPPPVTHEHEGELDYNILTKLREDRIATSDNSPDGVNGVRRSRKKLSSGESPDQ